MQKAGDGDVVPNPPTEESVVFFVSDCGVEDLAHAPLIRSCNKTTHAKKPLTWGSFRPSRDGVLKIVLKIYVYMILKIV